MSRVKIAGVVAVVVAALTLTAYLLTTASLEKRIEKDVEARVGRAEQLLLQTASLEGLGLMKRAETFARDRRLLLALAEADVVARAQTADQAFRQFVSELKPDEARPDFLALVNEKGEVAAMQDVPRPDPEDWKGRFAAVAAALDKRQVSKDIWDYRNGVMKVGVAPVYDPATGEVRGAVVLAFALNAKEAQAQAGLLGMDVAYFFQDRVRATSFRRGGAEEDVQKQEQLKGPLFDQGFARAALDSGHSGLVRFDLGGEQFVASAARLPLNYSDKTSGALVMMSLSRALEPVATVKLTIVLLGLGAIVIAVLAIFLVARVILAPVDEIEQGVTEIINGNVDYVFRPVGADFDGLANALNVMLARLLGRPEPGEEGFDEDGELAGASKVLLDNDTGSVAALGGQVATDPETLALAQEPEADYYRRLHTEYVAARKAAGEKVDGITFESFVAKLRLSEANLKKKYNCKAVRFRVVTKSGQVTLKPVPIL